MDISKLDLKNLSKEQLVKLCERLISKKMHITYEALTAPSKAGKKAADARHDAPGASRDLASQMRATWATGNFSSRDMCAEDSWRGLGFGSYKAARNALINTPDPSPWPAKPKKSGEK